MLNSDGLRPKGLRRVAEESGEHTIFIPFDVNLEGVDLRDPGILQDCEQTMRRYLETAGGGNMTGAKVLAVGLNHQLAVDVAGGSPDEGQVFQVRCHRIKGE